jgi:SAM-dependent methyltransferase
VTGSAWWTWRSALARAVTIARDEGLRSLWFKILGETGYRRLLVMELRLDEPLADVPLRVPAVIEPLRGSDVGDYVAFRPDTDPAEVRRRVAAGHLCFVARCQGRIVHACWAATGLAWVDYLAREVPLAPDEVYHYDSFTAPDLRGRNLSSARVTVAARHFRAAGYRRLVAVVVPESSRARRPLEKAGYRVVGRVGYIRLARWRWDFGPTHRSRQPSPGYWDGVSQEARRSAPLDAWHAYMRRVYVRLVHEWLPPVDAGRGLKTDLFEEAVSAHHVLSALGPASVGLDVSPAAVAAARDRLRDAPGGRLFVAGDLRQLPLRSSTITRILCGSSLDHFRDPGDIARSLAELVRVLAPRGVLVVTFDNPENPVIWLRNRLPFSWLRRLSLVPYYIGETYSRTAARRRLESLGLEVTDVTAVAHVPRAPAIWVLAVVERLGWTVLRRRLERVLDYFDALEHGPLPYRTGYYVALRARKCESSPTLLDPPVPAG